VFHVFAGVQLATLIMPRSASTDNGFASLPWWTIAWQFGQGMLWNITFPYTHEAYGRIIHLSDM
jgi:hypothetical protein